MSNLWNIVEVKVTEVQISVMMNSLMETWCKFNNKNQKTKISTNETVQAATSEPKTYNQTP